MTSNVCPAGISLSCSVAPSPRGKGLSEGGFWQRLLRWTWPFPGQVSRWGWGSLIERPARCKRPWSRGPSWLRFQVPAHRDWGNSTPVLFEAAGVQIISFTEVGSWYHSVDCINETIMGDGNQSIIYCSFFTTKRHWSIHGVLCFLSSSLVGTPPSRCFSLKMQRENT